MKVSFKRNLEVSFEMADNPSPLDPFLAKASEFITQVGSSLDNIVADEANLNQQIQALKTSSNLTAADQAKLDAISASMQAVIDRTKAVADAVPDLPVVTG